MNRSHELAACALLGILAAPGFAHAQYGRYAPRYAPSTAFSAAMVPCPTETSVVGRSRIRRFGAGWNHDGGAQFALRAGGSIHALSTQDLAFRGNNGSATFTAVPGQSGVNAAWAVTFDLGMSLIVFGPFYFGAEARAGGGSSSEFTAMDEYATTTLGGAHGFQSLAGLLSVGGVIPFGVIRGRAEVAVGAMTLAADGAAVHTDYSGSYTTEVRGTAFRALLEARVGLDVWLTPWLSAGATVGIDVLHAPSASLALFLQVHTRAYDAYRGPSP